MFSCLSERALPPAFLAAASFSSLVARSQRRCASLISPIGTGIFAWRMARGVGVSMHHQTAWVCEHEQGASTSKEGAVAGRMGAGVSSLLG